MESMLDDKNLTFEGKMAKSKNMKMKASWIIRIILTFEWKMVKSKKIRIKDKSNNIKTSQVTSKKATSEEK